MLEYTYAELKHLAYPVHLHPVPTSLQALQAVDDASIEEDRKEINAMLFLT